MKKLTFIRPPFEGMGIYKPPHLGVASLVGFLKPKFEDLNFNFIDALANHYSIEDIFQLIMIHKPDIIGFTVKTMQIEQTIELINRIKSEYNPLVICGGNHISVDPFSVIKNGADYAIIGEGEVAFERILNYEIYGKNISITNHPNIVTPSNINKIGPKPLVELSGIEIPTPDWSIIEISKYNENIHLNKKHYALPVMASRGCPFQCDFCSTHLTWTTKVRYRDATAVLEEISSNIKAYGINDYHFYDDNLMINRGWLIGFLELIKKHKVTFNWICLSRPDIIIKNQDLLPLMKECGCKGFELGFETDDDELYKIMNKKNTKTVFKEAYEILCEKKFELIEFLMMCYYDGETIHTLYETYKQLKTYKNQEALFVSSRYFATPFYGTTYYKKTIDKGHDISGGNRYKYAIFLNFMPNSFLESSMKGFSINPVTLEIQFKFLKIVNLIHEKEISSIFERFSVGEFVKLFNECSEKQKSINDFCLKIQKMTNHRIEVVYEYVGRLIEYIIERGVMNYKENTFLE